MELIWVRKWWTARDPNHVFLFGSVTEVNNIFSYYN